MAASMGVGREMIDWTKPIETVDGRKARMIEHLPDPPGDPNDEGYFVPRMVWVESARDHLFGDVFLVNDRGVRCDDTAWRARSSVPQIREPIIRNVRVKRKAWIRLAIHDYYKGDTKEEIESQITNPNFKAVYCEWEE